MQYTGYANDLKQQTTIVICGPQTVLYGRIRCFLDVNNKMFDLFGFFFSSRRRHTRYWRDWSSDVCSSDLRVQRHVVSDEQRAHADDAGARGRVHAGLANVGRALRLRRNLFLQQLEAAAPNVREVPSLRPRRGALVEVDGDAQLLPNPSARLARERDALLDAQAAHRHERQYVARPHARVLSRVRAQVYQLGRAPDDAHGRFDYRLGRGDEGYDGAVVIRVYVRAQDERALDTFEDRKSTRLNSSHANISYAVFCLKKKKKLTTSLISI